MSRNLEVVNVDQFPESNVSRLEVHAVPEREFLPVRAHGGSLA